jgi:hypothetical protein
MLRHYSDILRIGGQSNQRVSLHHKDGSGRRALPAPVSGAGPVSILGTHRSCRAVARLPALGSHPRRQPRQLPAFNWRAGTFRAALWNETPHHPRALSNRYRQHTEWLWGFATPETAPSYDLSAGAALGLTHRIELSNNSAINIMVLARIGEWLSENSCTADYGAIGGKREVNCRLSGSPLPPADTLDYLWNERTPDWGLIRVAYTVRF